MRSLHRHVDRMSRRPPLVYTVSHPRLDSPYLTERFVQSEQDAETTEFLERSQHQISIAKDLIAGVLRTFLSVTDANGLVNRGELFVFSQQQILSMLNINATGPKVGKLLLDVGAGSGSVTAKVAPFFDTVVATECSKPMTRALQNRGFCAVQTTELSPETFGARCFDVVMCLNVLDRADTPLTLLRQIRDLVVPGTGRLVIALVLPWCPFVEYGTQKLPPSEALPMQGGTCKEQKSFERSLKVFTENVLLPNGFTVERWTRLPYLSQGDQTAPYYVLSDVLMVLNVDPEFHQGADVEPVLPSVI